MTHPRTQTTEHVCLLFLHAWTACMAVPPVPMSVDSTMHFASVCSRDAETETERRLPYRTDHLPVSRIRRLTMATSAKKKLTNADRAKMFLQTEESRPGRRVERGHVFAINLCRAGIDSKGGRKGGRGLCCVHKGSFAAGGGNGQQCRSNGANGEGQICHLRCATQQPTYAQPLPRQRTNCLE